MSAASAILEPKMAAAGQRCEDGVPDMTAISDIDVVGVNTNLRVRFERNEIYTFTGTILVATNPYEFLPIYEKDMMMMYNGRKMGALPPHVFATAEAAYLNVQRSEKNQSCVISGESGAGKTETTKFILQYLCTVTSQVSNWVEQQILECNTILEAFGNAKTVRNDNSSRFGKFMQVCFDKKIEIKGMIVQEYLLEQSRIVGQSPTERNYHAFYQVIKGADKTQYKLRDSNFYRFTNRSGCDTIASQDDRKEFEKLLMAMTVLNIEDEYQQGIVALVSAVLLAGNLEFEEGASPDESQLTENDETLMADFSSLLEIDADGAEQCVTTRTIVVRGEATVIPLKPQEALANAEAMAKALYSRTFTWLIDQINQTTSPGQDTAKFIGVLDIFGFENFDFNSFEQLCINFTNEKLHKFFNHYVFQMEQEEYTREGIDWSSITFTDNTVCLECIEKPPKCVLKLLDEECKIPKGSDAGYLEKQHAAMESHPNYIKGADKRLWGEQFGIRHFAGEVMYTVAGFLAKNKDTDQGPLFELMRESENIFVKDVCRFQDMLSQERKMISAAKTGQTNKKAEKGGSTRGKMTNKAKPTVGDTFRRQLAQLVQILDTTTPWYVRCIKPNSKKAAKMYETPLVTEQLNYSGMLDIIRIRREGFPVHVPADVFVTKYSALANLMKGNKLSKDPRKAAVEILEFVQAPTTEWQLGKTKIFLRDSVFEPLEEKLKELLDDKVLLIQKTFRMHRAKKAYVKKRMSVMKIQAAVVGAVARLAYMQKRRSAIRIEAWWRGCMAREYVKALKIKLKKELERRKKEEEERRKKELAEKGDVLMEETFMQAQRELVAMEKVAEMKQSAALSKQSKSTANLDNIFGFLADDKKPTAAEDTEINTELDQLFADPTAQSPRADGKRTIRRKKRVQKKMLIDEANEQTAEASFNPAEFVLTGFAEEYYNEHPKSGTGTLSRRSTQRGKPKALDDPMSKADMCAWNKGPTIPTSLNRLHNPENVLLAVSLYKDLGKQMRGELKPEQCELSIQSVVAYCLEREELRNEIFCQLMRQTNNNPDIDDQLRGWHILCVCCVSFPPGRKLFDYLKAYIMVNQRDSVVGPYADWALQALKTIRLNGIRRVPPSRVEIDAIRAHQPIICRFYFLDGKAKAIGVEPSWVAADVIRAVASKIGLKSTAGWALFESTPVSEHFIRNHEYIGDILSEWEVEKRTSMQQTSYKTLSRKGATAAIGQGDAKFVFRKRLFLNPREISTDPVEYALVYAQAVHSVVRADEFPVTERTALQLAGLQAQVLWGNAAEEQMSRYDDVLSYIPWRITKMSATTTADQWKQKLYEAHREYGIGKTAMEAKVLYLTATKIYPLYGGTNFDVIYKGFWQFPNRLFLCIDAQGFKFVATRNKEILAEYTYDQLKNVEVNAEFDTITLNMAGSLTASHFMFQCPRKDDVANLIASYSPKHRNWKQVGVAAVTQKKTSAEDQEQNVRELISARSNMARQGNLMPPPKSKSFMPTTLRRKKSRKGSMTGNAEDDAVYDQTFWSYQKTKLTQPLTYMSSPETTEISQKTFNGLLVFAGLAKPSAVVDGFEEPDDPDGIALVQNVIGAALEKEDVCNEFYMQLIKQTTDQPNPDSTINAQNWRFLSLILGVVVPRHKGLLRLIKAHVKKCAADPTTEEGMFAQFCQQCLGRTLQNKNRKYPPSHQEIMCVKKRQQIYARFYFMDGEFRALMFDAASTTAEVVNMIKERVGLPDSVAGFSLFEVFGALERNMLPWEKVADAIYKWEKYAKNTRAVKELRLTFKKRLFLGPFTIPTSSVEFDLTFYQALDDVRSDVFPVTVEEGCQLAALRAQVEFGDWDQSTTYETVIEKYLPKQMRTGIDPEEVAGHHQKLKGKQAYDCNVLFLKFIMSWPLYGSTVFEVLQSYTTTLPKNLWLAVNEHGIHILKRRTKEPLISYTYRNIVNYSPSLRNLMIVTESLTRGTKFVFNTSQASQIAHLIKDYTHIIIQRTQQPGAAPGGGAVAAPPPKPVSAAPPPPKVEEPKRRRGSGSIIDHESQAKQRNSVSSINSFGDEEIRGFEDVDAAHGNSHEFKRKLSGEYGF